MKKAYHIRVEKAFYRSAAESYRSLTPTFIPQVHTVNGVDILTPQIYSVNGCDILTPQIHSVAGVDIITQQIHNVNGADFFTLHCRFTASPVLTL